MYNIVLLILGYSPRKISFLHPGNGIKGKRRRPLRILTIVDWFLQNIGSSVVSYMCTLTHPQSVCLLY